MSDTDDQSDHQDVSSDPPTDAKTSVTVPSKSKEKHGIIYLSYIPPGMNVKKVRQILARFGELGRIFLEPSKTRQSVATSYTEGWVEFKKKKIAKQVASTLNGTQVGGKRKNLYYDSLWSIKYLHRFKWNHLTEQMNYERSQRDQRLRFEMGRAKKEAEFYADQVDELKKRKRRKEETSEEALESRSGHYSKRQRRTDDQVRASKESAPEVDADLISRIFS